MVTGSEHNVPDDELRCGTAGNRCNAELTNTHRDDINKQPRPRLVQRESSPLPGHQGRPEQTPGSAPRDNDPPNLSSSGRTKKLSWMLRWDMPGKGKGGKGKGNGKEEAKAFIYAQTLPGPVPPAKWDDEAHDALLDIIFRLGEFRISNWDAVHREFHTEHDENGPEPHAGLARIYP
ncbi:hypothetical protein PG984_002977 [Apiospora sp. TS-2023a]